jgi:hypothetical protein
MELSTEKSSQIFARGGEGGRSVGQSCGSIRHTEKAKMEKKGEESTIRYEKKGVGGFHKAGFGRNPTTKNSHDADTLTTNTAGDCGLRLMAF